MVIDKTVQTNDFSGGMNTDTSDMILEKNTYRMAKNLRYVTNTQHNSAELHMIEGAVVVNDEQGNRIQIDNILESTQLRDMGVIVTGNDSGWKVYTYKENREPNLVCVADIQDTERVVGAKRLSLVTRYENENNQKLYIADGLGPILTVQLAKEEAVTDLDSVSSQVYVNFHNPVFCGLVEGGTINAKTVAYSYQYYTKYGPLSDISPSTKLIYIHTGAAAVSETNGAVEGYKAEEITDKAVKIKIDNTGVPFENIRIYRISYVENGQQPTIDLIYEGDITDEIMYYTDYGTTSLSTLTVEEYNAMTGVHIIPKTIESKNDYLFAANIKTDTGNTDKELFTAFVDEVTAKSYNKAGTIQPDKLNPYVDVNVDFDPTDEDAYMYDNEGFLGGVGEKVSWRFVLTKLVADYNDDMGYITRTSSLDNSFSEQVDKYYIKYNDDENRLQYYIQDDKIDLSNFIEVSDQSPTYQNSLVSYSLKSLRRGEVYRYGIVLYDNKGNHSDALWIADIRVPTTKQIPAYNVVYNDVQEDDDKTLYSYPIGIEFDVHDLGDDIEAYEIVRCLRTETDIRNVSQGVISRPIKRCAEFDFDKEALLATDRFPYTPTGWLMVTNYVSTGLNVDVHPIDSHYNELYATNIQDPFQYSKININYVTPAETNRDVFQFVSPEICYSAGDMKDIFNKRKMLIEAIDYAWPCGLYYTAEPDGSQFRNARSRVPDSEFKWVYFGNEWTLLFVEGWDSELENETKIVKVYNALVSGDISVALTLEKGGPQYYIYYQKDKTIRYIDAGSDSDVDGEYFFAKNRYQYIKLYTTERGFNIPQMDPLIYNIKDIQVASNLSWNDCFSSEADLSTAKLIYPDKADLLGTTSYVNWVCGGGYNVDIAKAEDDSDNSNDVDSFVMGPGGKCAVFQIDTDNELYKEKLISGTPISILGTYICNLKKNVTPYGGYSDDAIRMSTFKSFGNYFNKETSQAYIFDGDCYIMPLEYVSQHKWSHPLYKYGRSACIIYSIPVETNINLAYTDGFEFSRENTADDKTYLQSEPASVNGEFAQSEPLYSYNTAYSVNASYKMYAANNDQDDDLDSGTDFRVYHSNVKSDNETTDSWLKFMPANYLDVDSRHGAITGLRTFNNQLIFWQEDAAGILSVNERTAITDNSGLPLILGTGDVLARYDYIATSNGMREDEYSDAQSDAVLYWWDHNKHELCQYAGGLASVVLSKVKFVQNYINEMYKQNKLSERPVLVFDKEFNELLAKVDDEYTMVYNENIGKFTGLYQILPFSYIKFPDKLLLFNNRGLLNRWNQYTSDNNIVGINGTDKLVPYLKYIVNDEPRVTKVFDNGQFGGRVYGGDKQALQHISMTFKTPHKQEGHLDGAKITNREYNFLYAVPRNGDAAYGERLRGNTMSCEMTSDSNSYDFSLQFTLTKYRVSWS